MGAQLPLQVRVDFRDVLDRHQVFSDVPPDTARLGQPRRQERLDLLQKVRNRGQVTAAHLGRERGRRGFPWRPGSPSVPRPTSHVPRPTTHTASEGLGDTPGCRSQSRSACGLPLASTPGRTCQAPRHRALTSPDLRRLNLCPHTPSSALPHSLYLHPPRPILTRRLTGDPTRALTGPCAVTAGIGTQFTLPRNDHSYSTQHRKSPPQRPDQEK